MAEPESVHIGAIDLRTIRCRVGTDEGDLVLMVDDGEVNVVFDSGLGLDKAQAILGAERLASVARELAEALRAEVLSRKG